MDYSTTVVVLATTITIFLSGFLIFIVVRFLLKRNARRIHIYISSFVIILIFFPILGGVDMLIKKQIFSKYNVWYQLNELTFDNLGNLMWERDSVPCDVLNKDNCNRRDGCFYYEIDDLDICTDNRLE
ncbi:hypothetical protein JW962_01960 [Candidatus Dojkabacteria bacterium]|nr:hypothetical protein [Candidatus Dojkabacteria bacterium]